MTSSAQGKRDAMADTYYQNQMENGEFNLRHMDTLDQAFKSGFDAGYSLARNEAQVLVEALDNAVARCCAQCSADRISYLALAAYEKGDA